MMPLGTSGQLDGLLSTTITYCSLGTSQRIAWDVELSKGGREKGEWAEEVIMQIEMSFLSNPNDSDNKTTCN